MKSKIIVIAIFGLLGLIVGGIYEFNPHKEKSNYGVYALIFIFVAFIPLVKFIFPKLKEMEVGTLNFFPNLIKYFFGKK